MANQKTVAVIDAILTYYRKGWPQRRIARELAINRETVARYVAATRSADPNPAISTPGDAAATGDATALADLGAGPPDRPNPAISTPGDSAAGDSNPAISTAGTAGRQSLCKPLRESIEAKLETGLTAQRIYQDLVGEQAFAGSYQSVKRFVRELRGSNPQRFYRLECLPGEEAQVDFGSGPRVADGQGHFHQTWIFRIVLSYSRKAYSEAVHHQDTETFLRCLENAFRYFGGVPQTLVIDNLRAAVQRADWYEPELNPKMAEFARYYDTLVLPTRPYHPEHKGKVESSVKYVKNNALKGRRFASQAELSRFLLEWESQVADQRIHGTTRRQVGRQFTEIERIALQKLPPMPFPSFCEGRRTVHRDSYVEIAKAYYEVPEEFIGRELWVRWDARTVRVFNQRLEQVAVHARLAPGQFTPTQQSSRGRLCRVAQQSGYYREQAGRLGPACAQWAEQVFAERGPLGIRVVQGLLSLSQRHTPAQLDRACAQAVSYGTIRLADVRRLLSQPDQQTSFELLEEHPIIRPLQVYAAHVTQQLESQPQEIHP